MSFDFSTEKEQCSQIAIDWSKLDGKAIMITGATGLIGKYLIEVLVTRNEIMDVHTKIYAVGRDEEKFYQRFEGINLSDVTFVKQDVLEPFDIDVKMDYVIHMASNTHPRQYAMDPIGTEMSNIMGTYNLLNMISDMPGCRFVFTSSGDVYGDNRSDKEFLEESDCGYIDCNTLRAGYIEGKRASEALCNAYKEAKGVDFVTARLCRIYGPTMQLTDSKAISQFILNAIKQENIVLKSKGEQTFSYLYIYDVITAMLFIMTSGENGNAYNVADNNQALSLKELAGRLAEIGKAKVVYELPDNIEKKGASSFHDIRLDARKLYELGWKSVVGLEEGLNNTVEVLRGDRKEV